MILRFGLKYQILINILHYNNDDDDDDDDDNNIIIIIIIIILIIMITAAKVDKVLSKFKTHSIKD